MNKRDENRQNRGLEPVEETSAAWAPATASYLEQEKEDRQTSNVSSELLIF